MYGNPPKILDIQELHSNYTLKFEIKMTKSQFLSAQEIGFYKFFSLYNVFDSVDYYLLDKDNKLVKYKSANSILEEFFFERQVFLKHNYSNQDTNKMWITSLENFKLEFINYQNTMFDNRQAIINNLPAYYLPTANARMLNFDIDAIKVDIVKKTIKTDTNIDIILNNRIELAEQIIPKRVDLNEILESSNYTPVKRAAADSVNNYSIFDKKQKKQI